jgi:hypothetical protein
VWNSFKAINATCRTDSGFAAVSNVNTAGGGAKYDNEESFLFAEVMKYAYLVHAEGKLLTFLAIFLFSGNNTNGVRYRCSMASSEGPEECFCFQYRGSSRARGTHLVYRIVGPSLQYVYNACIKHILPFWHWI